MPESGFFIPVGKPVGGDAAAATAQAASADMVLHFVARLFRAGLDLKKTLDLSLDFLLEATQAESGFIVLRGEDNKFRVYAARNLHEGDIVSPQFEVSRQILSKAAQTGKPVVINDVTSWGDQPAASSSIQMLRLEAVCCMPLQIGGGPNGIVYLDHRKSGKTFPPDQVKLVTAFAEQIAPAIENAVFYEAKVAELQHLREIVVQQRESQGSRYAFRNIVSESRAMKEVLSLVQKIMATEMPVLLMGESGTGKELLARAIHHGSVRRAEECVAVNCGAIPETLFESELFGYEKGAFTGAGGQKIGLVEMADRGTLFLDEVGEMTQENQKKLLRVLQEGEIRRLGGKKPVKVNIRVISATNKDLEEMVKTKLFREDLFYRLAGVKVRVPPLRERKEDMPLLVDTFLQDFARETHTPPKKASPEATTALARYDWPGNIREVQFVIRQAAYMGEGDIIDADVIDEILQTKAKESVPAAASAADGTLNGMINALKKKVISEALQRCSGNLSEVARVLGISRMSLYREMDRLGLKYERQP